MERFKRLNVKGVNDAIKNFQRSQALWTFKQAIIERLKRYGKEKNKEEAVNSFLGSLKSASFQFAEDDETGFFFLSNIKFFDQSGDNLKSLNTDDLLDAGLDTINVFDFDDNTVYGLPNEEPKEPIFFLSVT